jgi:toxin-antitoxin system PIN domain toxin
MRIRMISFFLDLNVWLALSISGHTHNSDAWRWLNELSEDAVLLFSRYTQLGLLRLLTNTAAMGDYANTVQGGWDIYDRWLSDPRVQFHPEPRDIDTVFREITRPFGAQRASKWIGDCYLLAFSKEIGATLVTFDRALLGLAHKQNCAAIIPG